MRNPIYVGMITALAGLAIALAGDWLLVLLVPMSLVLHRGVVEPEERYLEQKFGDAWRDYTSRVARYGWPDQYQRPLVTTRHCEAAKPTKQSSPVFVAPGCFAEPVIGPAEGQSRWLAMTESSDA